MRVISMIAVALAVLLSGTPLRAQVQITGSDVVEKWCRACHLPPDAPLREGGAPAFESIVRRPGRTATYLRAFLDEDHFPMTTYRLFPHEKDLVVIYLDSLRHPKHAPQ